MAVAHLGNHLLILIDDPARRDHTILLPLTMDLTIRAHSSTRSQKYSSSIFPVTMNGLIGLDIIFETLFDQGSLFILNYFLSVFSRGIW